MKCAQTCVWILRIRTRHAVALCCAVWLSKPVVNIDLYVHRLNFRLNQACKDVLNEMCTDVCVDPENQDKACGGTVLRCLADKIDDVNDDACKQELLYFQKMEVSNAIHADAVIML